MPDYREALRVTRELRERSEELIRRSQRAMGPKELGAHDAPQLIILDLNMPRVDDMECLRQLRQGDARFRDVPVVMYTADFSRDRMREAARLGVRDYVVKGTMRWTDVAEIVQRDHCA